MQINFKIVDSLKIRIKYYIITFLLLWINTYTSVYAQESIIRGEIEMEGNPQMTLYSVKIEPLNTNLKAVVYSFVEKNFSFSCEFKNDVVITVSAYGYNDHILKLNIENTKIQELGVISLFANSIMLDGVVVSANKQISVEKKGANLTLKNIAGTPLGNTGNLVDMLKHTPGVLVKGENEISVIGRGTPIIYINGRGIKNTAELLSLHSSDVKSIEIIRKPSARYNATVQSVIRIQTQSYLKDQLGVIAQNTTNFKRKVGNSAALYLNGKKGIFSSNVSYIYGNSSNKAFEYSEQIITKPNNSFSNYSDGEFGGSGNDHNIFTGININTGYNSKFGMQYSGNYTNRDNYTKHNQLFIAKPDSIAKSNKSNEQQTNNLHNLSMNYTLTRNENSSLLFIGNYISRNKASDKYLLEKYLDENTHTSLTGIHTKNDYNVYTLEGEYTFKLFEKNENTLGSGYGHINNYGESLIYNGDIQNKKPQLTKMRNNYLNAYYTFDYSRNNIDMTLGLRYEYDQNKVNEVGNDTAVLMEYKYSNLFPTAALIYKINENIDISLNYNRRISRPSYHNLNPTIYYKDSLNYYTGNPYLKPTFYHELSISSNIQNFSISAFYEQQKNMVIWTDLLQSDNSNIIISKPLNLDNSHHFRFLSDYNYSNDKFNVYFSSQITFPYLKYPYLNETITDRDPYWEFSLKTGYSIYKTFRCFMNFYYTTSNNSGITHYGSTNSLNVGLSAQFFKKRLYTAIEANDLTGKTGDNWWEAYYRYSYSWQRNKYDIRGVKLTLRYTFNTIHSGFQKKNGNQDILFRL